MGKQVPFISEVDLRQLYWAEQMTMAEVAHRLGVDRRLIGKRLKKFNIPVRTGSEASRLAISKGRHRGYEYKLKDVPESELRRLYWDEELSCADIAEKFGVESHTVANYLTHIGIPKRNRSQQMNLLYQNGKFDNKCYASGERSHNWNGGRQRSNGYIRILKPGHYRANQKGYVLEHVLIWERAHKKRLPDGWVIHHLNGIKDDNRKENLLAMETSRHDRFIPRLKRRIKELEAEVATLKAKLEEGN